MVLNPEDIVNVFSQCEKEILEKIQESNNQVDRRLLREVVSVTLFIITDGMGIGIKDSQNVSMPYQTP